VAERYSFTKLSLADRCLRQFHERYEKKLDEKLPDTFAEMRDIGRAVHACFERYKEELHASGVEQDLSLVSLIVEQVMSDSREVATTRIYDEVFWVFRQVAQRYRHNPATYLGAEFLLQRELPETDIVIEGYPDHIETLTDSKGAIVVSTDLKTGYGTSVTDYYRFQGEITSWMLLEWFEGARVGWRVDYPRTEFVSEIEEFEPIASMRLEGRMRSIIARVQRAREERKWPATPGSVCEYCPIAASCAARNVLVKNAVLVTNEDEAVGAATDLIILDAAYTQRVEQLKEWARENGPLAIGDVTVGYETSKSENLRIADVGILLLQLGVQEAIAQQYATAENDPWLTTKEGITTATALGAQAAIRAGLLTVNGNKTKAKAVQNDPRLVGLWIPPEPTTRFGIHKAKVRTP
jgi:hypothetical protein